MIVVVIATGLLLIALIGLLFHFVSFTSNPWLALAAFSAYPMLAAPVALALLLITREWWIAGLAALIVIACGLTQLPLYVGQSAPSSATRLVMMTANLRLGQADPQALVALVRSHHVDVLTLQELTPGEVRRLTAAGLDDVLPHSSVDARWGADGSGVYSRFDLQQEPTPPGFLFALVVTQVVVPGVTAPVTVVATHMPGPGRTGKRTGPTTSPCCPRRSPRWGRPVGPYWSAATSTPPPTRPSSAGC